jgi:hypothetical protein
MEGIMAFLDLHITQPQDLEAGLECDFPSWNVLGTKLAMMCLSGGELGLPLLFNQVFAFLLNELPLLHGYYQKFIQILLRFAIAVMRAIIKFSAVCFSLLLGDSPNTEVPFKVPQSKV